MFVVCSALSLLFYGYFYCVCLLHIVIVSDILQRVLRSVTKNGNDYINFVIFLLVVKIQVARCCQLVHLVS